MAIAFAHLISQHDYGTYKYILSLAALFGAISLGGIGTALTRSIAKGYDGTLMAAFWLNFRWSILVASGMLVLALYNFSRGNTVVGAGMLFVGALNPFLSSFSLYTSVLTGKKQFPTLSLFTFVDYLVPATAMLGALLLRLGPAGLVAVYYLSNTLILGVLFWRIRKWYIANALIDPIASRLGTHLSVLYGFAGIVDRLDNILVYHYMGPVQLAIYSFATIIPDAISGFAKNLSTIAVPRFVTQNKELAQGDLFRKTFLLGSLLAPVAITYAAVCPYFFAIYFHPYLTSVPYSQVYGLIILFSVGSVSSSFMDAHVAIREKYIIYGIAAVSKIAALFIGVLFYGIWGVIIATVVTKLVAQVITYLAAMRI
jgi:O-antigen/teichoic acid export membrane protein